jgi:hypothetical protein
VASEHPREVVTQEAMSEQAQKVKNKNIPEWAQGLYYSSGLSSEVMVYHDQEAIYFEHKGKDSGIVRFTFDQIEGLKMVEDEEVPTHSTEERADLTAKNAG